MGPKRNQKCEIINKFFSPQSKTETFVGSTVVEFPEVVSCDKVILFTPEVLRTLFPTGIQDESSFVTKFTHCVCVCIDDAKANKV